MNENEKLLLSIVLDSSASMKGEKFSTLKNAINDFQNELIKNHLEQKILYSITVFDGLKSKVIKNFTDIVFSTDKVFAGGIPVFSKSIEMTVDNLNTTIDSFTQAGNKLYKPFLIILMDGINFGDLTNTTEVLKKHIDSGRFAYFPFLLSSNPVDESFQPLFKLKWPLAIIQNKYSNLFQWLWIISRKRIETPLDQSISLDPKLFEGWIRK